uniref:Uncharacterized protein n=1 Tax=viral metagenome TaxID=1070528 RepID=A0A6M3LU89_9ZZZZ
MAWEQEGILGASMRWANKKGETAFEMKRKDKYGDPYYIFKIYKDHFNEEQRKGWPAVWALIRMNAAKLGLPLYDYREIADAVYAQLNLIARTPESRRAQRKVDETGDTVFVQDITIKVFDHATGRINDLTLGISTAPVNIVTDK